MSLEAEDIATPLRKPAHIRWELYHTNRVIWQAMLAQCEQARESIAIEQYILSPEGIGRQLLDLLARRAREGIRVRVLADWFGSRALLESEGADILRRSGGEISHFNGIARILRTPRDAFHRLHRKTVICDGSRLMTGGTCIEPRMADWRDTMALIEGPVAGAALTEFDTTWLHVADPSKPVSKGANLESADALSGWAYLISSPFSPPCHQYREALLQQVRQADRSVTLASPYISPMKAFWDTLIDAAQRGVKVRVMIPAWSDHPIFDRLVSRRFARTLSRQGIDMHGYTESMFHAKLAVVDGRWAGVGSFNLGIDSFRLNLECVLVGTEPGFVEAVAGQLERDLATSCRF